MNINEQFTKNQDSDEILLTGRGVLLMLFNYQAKEPNEKTVVATNKVNRPGLAGGSIS